jgi:hypothetical protein
MTDLADTILQFGRSRGGFVDLADKRVVGELVEQIVSAGEDSGAAKPKVARRTRKSAEAAASPVPPPAEAAASPVPPPADEQEPDTTADDADGDGSVPDSE